MCGALAWLPSVFAVGEAIKATSILPKTGPDALDSRSKPLPVGAVEAPSRPEPSKASNASASKVKFRVSTLVFEGNSVLPRAELKALAKPYENRQVTLLQLRNLCLKIRDAYRTRGYVLARAGVPPQKIKAGRVKIAISEGKFGTVKVQGNEHYSSDFIQRMFRPGQRGGIVRQRQVERALVVLNEFPDLIVRSAFDIGRRPGTTDVTLKVKDESPTHVTIDYNNYGNRLVGRNRGGVGVNAGSLLTDGDDLSAHVAYLFPSDSEPLYQVGYTLPVGDRGDRLGVSYLNSATRVGEELKILDIRGKAEVASLNWTHAFSRTPRFSSSLTSGLVLKDIDNRIFGNQIVSDDRLREFTMSYDSVTIHPKGRTIRTAAVTQGLGTTLGGRENGDLLTSRPGARAGNTFTKFNIDQAHLQRLSAEDFLLLRVGSQVTTDALTVPELFAIGGPDTVRGFTQSAFLGDNGYTTSAEFRHTMMDQDDFNLQGVAFVDHGWAELKRPLVGEKASRSLTGAGLGVRAAVGKTTSMRLDVGFPVSGETPQEDSSVLYGQVASKF